MINIKINLINIKKRENCCMKNKIMINYSLASTEMKYYIDYFYTSLQVG